MYRWNLAKTCDNRSKTMRTYNCNTRSRNLGPGNVPTALEESIVNANERHRGIRTNGLIHTGIYGTVLSLHLIHHHE